MTSSKLPNNELVTPPAASKPETKAPELLPDQAQLVELSNSHSPPSATGENHADAANDGQSAAQRKPSAASARLAEEREEILNRIAAFRNLQTKLRQDREKYYDQTLARTRSLLSEPLKPRR